MTQTPPTPDAPEPLRVTIDYERLKERCLQPIASFAHEPGFQMWTTRREGDPENRPYERYFFKDNGAKVLAVAHLDTVNHSDHFAVVTIEGKDVVFTQQADDRLGVYLILDLLPQLLVEKPYDILLTEGEEVGKSTARIFNAKEPGTYNWMFECDRAGTDVVGYDYYRDPQWSVAARAAGWTSMSRGSNSDIAYLDFMGVLAWNFGVGYAENHSRFSRIEVNDLIGCVRRTVAFIQQHRDTHFPFDPKKLPPATYGGSYGSDYSYGHFGGRGRYSDEDYGKALEQYRSKHIKTTPRSEGSEIQILPKGDVRYTFNCNDCGRSFTTSSAKAQYCDDCASLMVRSLQRSGFLYKIEGKDGGWTWGHLCFDCGQMFVDDDPYAEACPDCEKAMSDELGEVLKQGPLPFGLLTAGGEEVYDDEFDDELDDTQPLGFVEGVCFNCDLVTLVDSSGLCADCAEDMSQAMHRL